jgi:cytosine/adenosine deaminase-related metal-dependent hydrolase
MAAKVLGLDKELGSVEVGKKAISSRLTCFNAPLPIDMLIYRLVYNATGKRRRRCGRIGRLVMEGVKISPSMKAQVLERVQAV